VFERAVSNFERGRIAESVSAFDELIAMEPDLAPHLWQRGIALYYAGRYEECRRQFESHRRVNPNDVENAAWHFLCLTRLESPEKARAALLPTGSDTRTPMPQIYQMFRGAASPEEVLTTADGDIGGQFYAHLYVGLFFEALGKADESLQHVKAAADPRFARVGGYMHIVARVHRELRQSRR
jgi:lipoprotein NlpI